MGRENFGRARAAGVSPDARKFLDRIKIRVDENGENAAQGVKEAK